MYRYRATITNVVDGDTVDAVLDLQPIARVPINDEPGFLFDLGFSIYSPTCTAGAPVLYATRLRLARINTPETNRRDEREAGLVSEEFVRNWLEDRGNVVEIESTKAGKFGRYLAEITDHDGENLSDLLVEKGLAEWYPGAGPRESSE